MDRTLFSFGDRGGFKSPHWLILVVLVIFLSIFRWLGNKPKEAIMKHKNNTKRSKAVLSFTRNVAKLVTHFGETVWAIGVGIVAGKVPIPIY
jgi:hypothetical protein